MLWSRSRFAAARALTAGPTGRTIEGAEPPTLGPIVRRGHNFAPEGIEVSFMQTETVIIMIVGLAAIGLIRLVIAMVGREYAADHPHVKSRTAPSQTTPSDDSVGPHSTPAVPSPRPVRGTGRRSHLMYFPGTESQGTVDTPDSPATPQAS
jgi:hypothetical protein